MGAWSVRVTHAAKQDLSAIRVWTRLHFGAEQERIYATTLALAVRALTDGPDIAGVKQRDDLAPGICMLHVARQGRHGRHFVAFRTNGKPCIDVLRILHDSMGPGTAPPTLILHVLEVPLPKKAGNAGLFREHDAAPYFFGVSFKPRSSSIGPMLGSWLRQSL